MRQFKARTRLQGASYRRGTAAAPARVQRYPATGALRGAVQVGPPARKTADKFERSLSGFNPFSDGVSSVGKLVANTTVSVHCFLLHAVVHYDLI